MCLSQIKVILPIPLKLIRRGLVFVGPIHSAYIVPDGELRPWFQR